MNTAKAQANAQEVFFPVVHYGRCLKMYESSRQRSGSIMCIIITDA